MAGQTGTIRPPITADDLFESLEAKIISFEFGAGTRLPSERQIATGYGLSRPVVREVLRRLEERGLIAVYPGRGSYVLSVEPTSGYASVDHLVRRGGITARDLVIARRMLECESAALAAEHHDSADAEKLQILIEEFESNDDVAVCAGLDVAFHEAIVVASGNEVLQMMFGSIGDLTHAMVLRSLTDRAARNAGAPFHFAILEAILQRDATAARAAMASHIGLALEHYGHDIDLPLARVLSRRADTHPEVAAILRRASASLSGGADSSQVS